jgi:hypothetical protein
MHPQLKTLIAGGVFQTCVWSSVIVSKHGVGVFVRGERGTNSDEVEHRLRPYAARLKKAVGVDKFFLTGDGMPPAKYFFQKFKSFNSSRPNNWGKMADWLHKEADAYQDALHKVMEIGTDEQLRLG